MKVEEIYLYECYQCEKGFNTKKALYFHIVGSKDHYGRGNAYEWLKAHGYIKEKDTLHEIYKIGGDSR